MRLQAALRNSGYTWPGPKVTINLAPADVRKDSAAAMLAKRLDMRGILLPADKAPKATKR